MVDMKLGVQIGGVGLGRDLPAGGLLIFLSFLSISTCLEHRAFSRGYRLRILKTAWQDAGSSLWQWKIYQGMNTGLYATELDRFSNQVCEDIHDYPTDWINFFLLQSATNVHIINDYLHMFCESVNGHPSRTVICRYIVCSNIAWNYWDVIFRPYHPAL